MICVITCLVPRVVHVSLSIVIWPCLTMHYEFEELREASQRSLNLANQIRIYPMKLVSSHKEKTLPHQIEYSSN